MPSPQPGPAVSESTDLRVPAGSALGRGGGAGSPASWAGSAAP